MRNCPIILSCESNIFQRQVEKLESEGVERVDYFDSQIGELFEIRHPKDKDDEKKKADFIHKYHTSPPQNGMGNWVYYPWLNKVFHLLAEEDFIQVITSRNSPLVTFEEHQSLKSLTIGIVGLSVGSNIAIALAHAGIGKSFKLADSDSMALSNLNRVLSGVESIGVNKAILAARKMFEINPYLEIEMFSDGITEESIESFLINKKIDLIFDECDDLILKFYLRLAARSMKIPLFMVSDIGYKVEITTLGFDLNQHAGKMEDVPPVSTADVILGYKLVEKLELTDNERLLLIDEIIGEENISPEMKRALIQKSNGELVSFPQLGSIALMGGGLAVLAVISALKFKGQTKESVAIDVLQLLAKDKHTHRKLHTKNWDEMYKKHKRSLNS